MVFAPAPPASSSPRSPRPKPPTSSFDASLLYATEEVPTLPPVMAVPLPKTSLVGAGATGGSRRGSSTRESLRRRKKGATKASEARIDFLNKKINKGMHGSGAAALTMVREREERRNIYMYITKNPNNPPPPPFTIPPPPKHRRTNKSTPSTCVRLTRRSPRSSSLQRLA